MDLDLPTVLQGLVYGVLALIGLSLVGLLIDVATALLTFLLKAGVVVLIILFVLQLLEGSRG